MSNKNNFNKEDKKFLAGFSLFEVLIYLSIAFVVLAVIVGFVFWLIDSNNKNRIIAQTIDSSKRAMEIITYEVKAAENIYAPTSSGSQLSLKTNKYLPEDEKSTYIDFYLCGTQLCLKRESQDPIILTPPSIEISNLSFTYILFGPSASIKIDLTANYQNPSNRPEYNFSTNLISTVSLRSY